MPVVYLGLGSNMKDRHTNIEQAISMLKALPDLKISEHSSLIETKPEGKTNQAGFINYVLKVSTGLTPQVLLNNIQKIENDMGRIRTEKWGPRIIDIDILFYADKIINEKDLVIPHPEIPKRNFILRSLVEICPGLEHPLLKRTMLQLLEDKKRSANVKN